ncbi:phosphohistidine phosphatase SixA [Pseudomonas cavernae]|uniref:Phosphohistidine phosphatase SixA n=1 Tax=Pseudomonas cavernae TaxID=2320867 RepID=A0A385Z2R4_9PSED|nr:phosphohistidine phosphatase SixA [Pseudomonas cavernae]AYC33376.1 phosphohistidine phosphatase SixA [Pseudomonas cavernae]
MRLWLLRHGEAEPQARTDAERHLTKRGRKDVLLSAAQLEGRPLTAILASPYVRAQQTAELVREALGVRLPITTAPWLTPDSSPAEALRQLDNYVDGELLLVSHNPFVGDLAGLLLHGHRQQPLPMQTASLAELDGEMYAAGSMELLAVVHPH